MTGLQEGQALALAPLRIQQAQNAVKEQQLSIYQMGLENRAKSAMLDNQIKSLNLKVQEQDLAVKSQQEQMAAWQQDAPKLTAWMALPAEQKITTDPGVTSQKGLQLFELGLNAAQAQVYRKQDSEMRTNAILDRQRMIEENKTALEGVKTDARRDIEANKEETRKQIAEMQAQLRTSLEDKKQTAVDFRTMHRETSREIVSGMKDMLKVMGENGANTDTFKEAKAMYDSLRQKQGKLKSAKTVDEIDSIMNEGKSSIVPTDIPEGTAPRVVGKVTLDGQFIPAK